MKFHSRVFFRKRINKKLPVKGSFLFLNTCNTPNEKARKNRSTLYRPDFLTVMLTINESGLGK